MGWGATSDDVRISILTVVDTPFGDDFGLAICHLPRASSIQDSTYL